MLLEDARRSSLKVGAVRVALSAACEAEVRQLRAVLAEACAGEPDKLRATLSTSEQVDAYGEVQQIHLEAHPPLSLRPYVGDFASRLRAAKTARARARAAIRALADAQARRFSALEVRPLAAPARRARWL